MPGIFDTSATAVASKEGPASLGMRRCRHLCSNGAATRSGRPCKHKCCHQGLPKASDPDLPSANVSSHDSEYEEIAEEDLLPLFEMIDRSPQSSTVALSSASDGHGADTQQIEDSLSAASHTGIRKIVPEQMPHLHMTSHTSESPLPRITMSNAWDVGPRHRRILHVDGWPRETSCDPVGLYPKAYWCNPAKLYEACSILEQKQLSLSDIQKVKEAFAPVEPLAAHTNEGFLGSVY
ncbi:hypothetical protein GGR57DRAFT_497937 [Xylariaceae sp. FL1272]|nr:hypothetical protein GGR57DRAFT_497937 [Xylariaceae sp. FL1272]